MSISGLSSRLYRVAGCTVLLTLAGCETLDAFLPPAATAAPVPAVSENIQQICATVRDNEVRANSQYSGKRLSLIAKFDSVKRGSTYDSIYRGTLRNRQAARDYSVYEVTLRAHSAQGKTDPMRTPVIVAMTTDMGKAAESQVSNLSKDKLVQVTGTVATLQPVSRTCMISLKDATFMPAQ